MKLKNRGTAGFTLMEVVIAVALIVILAGLVGVSVINYQRSLYFLEQESIAKEIFVAAQNHLTMADSQGLLSQKTTEDATGVAANDADKKKDIFYFVHTPGSTLAASSVLGLMLPEYSLDATVRIGGSYIIRYQRSTALVLDVFYASPQGSTFGGRYGYTLSARDVTDNKLFTDYIDDANKEKRLKYPNGTGDYVIGWYGASAGDVEKGDELKAPEVIIKNAERLTVTVKNPNVSGNEATAQLKLVVTGKESKAVKVFELIGINDQGKYEIPPSAKTTAGYLHITHTDESTFTLVFDDITSNKHFAEVFKDVDPNMGREFIPGEDLRIEAVAFDNTKLVNIAKSGEKTTNSLFASLKVTRTGSSISSGTARIANMRHLENLDARISKVDDTLRISGAEQMRNIYWTDNSWTSSTTTDVDTFIGDLKGFKEIILAQKYLASDLSPSVAGIRAYLNGTNSMEITKSDGSSVYTTKDLYVPIQLSGLLDYKGKLHFIANVTAQESEDAGLFAELKSGSSIENLELRDFSITSTAGNAGALAGSATGATINGVLVRNTRANDASCAISGKNSAGGLVGAMKGGSISLSAAAVVVNSTEGDAGGLVGSITGSALATIENSYSGGRTKDGAYYEKSGSTMVPIYNVQANKGSAGGLVGTAANANITNCYSTCSAQGKTSVGGLVGTISAGSVEKSYATGLVGKTNDTGVLGCFVGNLNSSVTLGANEKANSYFSLVNLYDADGTERTISAIGSAPSNTAVSAFDASAATYNAFATGTAAAYPYDTYLVSKGASTYPLKNIATLSGTTSALKHATMHFGDWPMPEVLIVNTK